MGTIKKNVGEPMRLRLNLGDNASGKYVRAHLSSDGAPLPTPYAVLTELDNGLYGNNTYLMPFGFPMIDVKYIVYLDAAFTLEDPTYFSATDQYEVDDFDPTNFLPPFPQQVIAQVENGRMDIEVKPPGDIEANVGAQSSIDALVAKPGAFNIEIKQETEIEGVLND